MGKKRRWAVFSDIQKDVVIVMSNIFTYRPKLQYVYDRIDTINNVLSQDEYNEIQEYLPSLNTEIIKDFLSASDSFNNLYDKLKDKVIKQEIKYNKRIPGTFYTVLSNFKGGDQFIKTGSLTTELIDELRKEPVFGELIYNIDNDLKGINGDIWQESYNALKKVKNLQKYYRTCLDKTLFLWYNGDEKKDIDLQVREGILLDIEKYLKNSQLKKESIAKCDDDLYRQSDYNMAYLDKILCMTNNAFYVTNQMTSILDTAVIEYSDLIDDEVIEEYSELVKQRGSRLLENSELQHQDVRMILYDSFKKNKQDVDRLEIKSAGVFTPDKIYSRIGDYGKASKHYRDICAGTITSFKTINDGNGYGYINSLVDGLDYMSDDYMKQSIQISNYFRSFQEYFSSLTDGLFRKNDARNLFNYYMKMTNEYS